MDRLTENKIILVKRKTRLDELIARYNTVMQAKFYIEHMGQDFSDYLNEHQLYYKAIEKTKEILQCIGRLHLIDRSFLPNFIFGKDDVVVAIGQDGLVANTLKYLKDQPLIGVNPDPERWDGVLLPFNVEDLKQIIPDVFRGKRSIKKVSLAKVSLNDGQSLLAVNDFFIGQKTHISSRYKISINNKEESQSSSGIIVSTGMGSTGWFKSVLSGASGVTNYFSEKKMIIKPLNKFKWDADYLYYSVREPFPSKSSFTSMTFGKIDNKQPLKVLSLMGENGVIFSDGVENDFLSFNSGIEAQIKLADHKGLLIV